MRTVIGAAIALLLLLSLVPGPSVAAQANCGVVLGFRTLHDMIPGIVGNCVTNELHNPENGDGLQVTTGGLLVWRKADNWTAFTDGSTTWVNGPYGLQSRPNHERFAWEAPPNAIPIEVFFSRHPESDANFGAVFPVQRYGTDQGVASEALQELIQGPTTAERDLGYYSELGAMLRGPSTCGGASFSIRIETGTATVHFCRQIVSAGVGQDARVQSQIEATLKQFSTVQQVRLLTQDGRCLFDQSGLDRCLQD